VILAVNTAEETLQLVLARGGPVGRDGRDGRDGRNELILEIFEESCAGRMNEVMAPAVAAMLARASGKVAAVACVRGPGSFTGVRLGLAFATGLCLARQLPMAGLDYLPLLAARGFAESGGVAGANRADGADSCAEVHVITHSRTAKVYHQGFVRCGQESAPVPLEPPRDLTVQAAREIILSSAGEKAVTVLGSGLRRNPEAFAGLTGATLLPIENPTPEVLVQAALAATFDGPPVAALYLRGSDAEENLAKIAAGRGLTEEEALERMERAMR